MSKMSGEGQRPSSLNAPIAAAVPVGAGQEEAQLSEGDPAGGLTCPPGGRGPRLPGGHLCTPHPSQAGLIAPGLLVPRRWGTRTGPGLLGTSWPTLGCPAVPPLGSRSKTSQEQKQGVRGALETLRSAVGVSKLSARGWVPGPLGGPWGPGPAALAGRARTAAGVQRRAVRSLGPRPLFQSPKCSFRKGPLPPLLAAGGVGRLWDEAQRLWSHRSWGPGGRWARVSGGV